MSISSKTSSENEYFAGVSLFTWRKTTFRFNKREITTSGKFTKCSLLAICKLHARQILSLFALPTKNVLLTNARKDHSIPLMLNGSDYIRYVPKYTCDIIGFFRLRVVIAVSFLSGRWDQRRRLKFSIIWWTMLLNYIKDVLRKSSDSLLYKIKITTGKKNKLSVTTYLLVMIKVEDPWKRFCSKRKKKPKERSDFKCSSVKFATFLQ